MNERDLIKFKHYQIYPRARIYNLMRWIIRIRYMSWKSVTYYRQERKLRFLRLWNNGN